MSDILLPHPWDLKDKLNNNYREGDQPSERFVAFGGVI